MIQIKDVSMKTLLDELGRREMSATAMALFQRPVETVEEYLGLKQKARTYSRVFASQSDSAEKGLLVTLLFREFDTAVADGDEIKVAHFKSKLDSEFACLLPQ